jgi:Spy/CpxP family protein refolding chaperone
MRLKSANAVAAAVSVIVLSVGGAVAQSRRPGGASLPAPESSPSAHRSPGGIGQPTEMGEPGHSRTRGHDRDRREPVSPSSPAVAHESTNPIRFGPVGRWWDDRQVVRSIGLTAEQQRKMDSIFNANKPAIVDSYKAYLREKANLDALSKKDTVDKSAMFAAIDSANQARAKLQKVVADMLLQIRQQMQPEQVEKLENLQ